MKVPKFIIIFVIIGYCLTDPESFDCESEFENILIKANRDQCTNIGSCSYNSTYKRCQEIQSCDKGNGKDEDVCKAIIPTEFNFKKCYKDGSDCKSIDRKCPDDWKKLAINNDGFITFEKDNCTELKAPADQGNRCVLRSGECLPHFDECRSITTEKGGSSKCNGNIPKDPLYKCEWKNPVGSPPQDPYCDKVKNKCSSPYYHGKDICNQLDDDDVSYKDKKDCVYNFKSSRCKFEYNKCEDIDNPSINECKKHMPLYNDGKDYNYKKKCIYDESDDKCISTTRKCGEEVEFDIEIPEELLSEEFCGADFQLSADYYYCAYNKEEGICYEEYKKCEDYISNKIENDREICENIKPYEKNTKCVYDIKEDLCQTKLIYEKCDDYKGKDKKTCESIILSPTDRPYCILDKDSNCIERPLFCSEAYNPDDCLNIAKSSDDNKRCAWYVDDFTNEKKCYEEYIRCEDYLGDSSSECQHIILYNGNKCKWESNRCRSNNKICENTEKEEECKMIAQTGVSDPERKVCVWNSHKEKCLESYKYCSDYREKCQKENTPKNSIYMDAIQVESDCQDFCENTIKPYDESGNNIDIGFKCYYEYGVGCQKIPVQCTDAGDNPVLCELYNNYIKDNTTRYCGFFEGTCKEYSIKCEFVEYDNNHLDNSECTGNIIKTQEGYIFGVCEDDNGKCVQKNVCSHFGEISTNYNKVLCESLNPNCKYDNSKCESVENICDETKFYSYKEDYKGKCEGIEVSDPYKKCTIKEDKSGCESVYRELPYSTHYSTYSTPSGADNQENADFISKGINYIILVLFLLF